jgi:hypothetical protein
MLSLIAGGLSTASSTNQLVGSRSTGNSSLSPGTAPSSQLGPTRSVSAYGGADAGTAVFVRSSSISKSSNGDNKPSQTRVTEVSDEEDVDDNADLDDDVVEDSDDDILLQKTSSVESMSAETTKTSNKTANHRVSFSDNIATTFDETVARGQVSNPAMKPALSSRTSEGSSASDKVAGSNSSTGSKLSIVTPSATQSTYNGAQQGNSSNCADALGGLR